MGCFRVFTNNLKNFVLRFDMLAADATLRVRGEPSYESFGCGLFSIVIVGLFIGIFAQNIISVFQKAQISATLNYDDEPTLTSSENITGVRFAIGIEQTTFDDTGKIFDFSLESVQQQSGTESTSTIQLVPCTEQIWNSYGGNIEHFYSSLKVSKMLCVPQDADTTLFGYDGNSDSNWLKLSVSKCSNNPSGCNTDADIKTFFDGIGYIPVRLLFLNSIISPENQVAVSTTIQKDIFLSFSQNLGTRGSVTIGKFSITTDQSIWPFSSLEQVLGHYIEDYRTYTVPIIPTAAGYDPNGSRNNKFVELTIKKSTLIYQVERTYEKIDELLSYIGGLFSLLFFVIFFIFGPFNEYRYELLAASPSFTYEEGNEKVDETDMGYCTYFLYSLYDWFKTIGINCNWEHMKKIDEVREEAKQLLDVANILHKLRYYDWCLSLLMKQQHKIASYLVKPLTISQSRKNRKMFEYYDKVMKSKKIIDSDSTFKQAARLQMEGGLPVRSIRKVEKFPKPGALRSLQQQDNYDRYNANRAQVFTSQIETINLGSRKKSRQKASQEEFQNSSSELKIDNKGVKQKNERKCCYMEEEFDSEDQQAERLIYAGYLKLQKDNVEAAQKIKTQIPGFLDSYLKNKMMNDNSGKLN